MRIPHFGATGDARAMALRAGGLSLFLCLAAAGQTGQSWAGNEANFVLCSHHTEQQGVTEINAFSDSSTGFKVETPYSAQMLEIEHAFTDRLMAAVHIEGDSIEGEGPYKFGAFRAEARYRLFEYGEFFLNPGFSVEYEHATTAERYKHSVVGRADALVPVQIGNAIETRLVFGHDFSDRFDVAFDWISFGAMETGHWDFGYALGLNYTIFEEEHSANREKKGRKGGEVGELERRPKGWGVKAARLGAEFFGGAGDAWLGLTMDPRVTEQYAGLNLKTEFQNSVHVMMGGALGLSGESDHGIFRLQVGYEWE